MFLSSPTSTIALLYLFPLDRLSTIQCDSIYMRSMLKWTDKSTFHNRWLWNRNWSYVRNICFPMPPKPSLSLTQIFSYYNLWEVDRPPIFDLSIFLFIHRPLWRSLFVTIMRITSKTIHCYLNPPFCTPVYLILRIASFYFSTNEWI